MGRRTCSTREGAAIWCNPDPCGLVCACITYGLIAYAQYAVTLCLVRPWMGSSLAGMIHTIAFNVLACLAHASHARAMLTDPGAVSRYAEPPSAEVEAGEGPPRLCRKCDAYKPVRAHHCSICRRCIVKMDHHCPWVNNCVGIGNHKFFIQFISYVFSIAVYALGLVFCRFVSCVSETSGCDDPSTNLLVVLLVVEAMLFGMFTVCMVCDQWEVVTTNQTHIDRLKGETHSQSMEINEVFGGARTGGRRFRLDCFLPTRVVFPADIWEDVMGYRCRDACGLAAAVVSKARRRSIATGESEDDDDTESDGDMELGEFIHSSRTMRERRQQVDAHRLLGRDGGGAGSGSFGLENGSSGGVVGGGGGSLGNSPHQPNHMLSASGASALLIPGGVGGGVGLSAGGGRRDDTVGKNLP